ncbi:MAG: hypothetical protein ACFFD2_29455, partial [Promethearchaeota archaeon]
LREIVISDMRQVKKDRKEFFEWLNNEIDRRTVLHYKDLPNIRKGISSQIIEYEKEITEITNRIKDLNTTTHRLRTKLDQFDYWHDFHRLSHDFRIFLQMRDPSLIRALDPVITVHPDQVSFEAFSLDESTYGCLSIPRDEFNIVGTPQLGTTNIDFSAKLATEMERFRTYTNVELSINPGGFTVDTGVTPEHLEKKIDLPETWIKGFNQASAAASLKGLEIELLPIDIYDICSFLRRNKADRSPRAMRWILEPNEYIKIIFEPWEKEIELSVKFNGSTRRIERIWGRRRWLVLEKLIPISKSFKIKLLGFGMPQFLIADLTYMKLTIGFTSWSANDWVKGTAFNILAGYIGAGNEAVYDLLKKKRYLSMQQINDEFKDISEKANREGIGNLLRRGEAYFDLINEKFRFRQLLNVPVPEELYQETGVELEVQNLLNKRNESLSMQINEDLEMLAKISYKIPNPKYNKMRYYGRSSYREEFFDSNTEIRFGPEKEIFKVNCKCKEFQKGPRNISSPCAHLLSLYISAMKFINFPLKPGFIYNINALEDLKSND